MHHPWPPSGTIRCVFDLVRFASYAAQTSKIGSAVATNGDTKAGGGMVSDVAILALIYTSKMLAKKRTSESGCRFRHGVLTPGFRSFRRLSKWRATSGRTNVCHSPNFFLSFFFLFYAVITLIRGAFWGPYRSVPGSVSQRWTGWDGSQHTRCGPSG